MSSGRSESPASILSHERLPKLGLQVVACTVVSCLSCILIPDSIELWAIYPCEAEGFSPIGNAALHVAAGTSGQSAHVVVVGGVRRLGNHAVKVVNRIQVVVQPLKASATYEVDVGIRESPFDGRGRV